MMMRAAVADMGAEASVAPNIPGNVALRETVNATFVLMDPR
jgi:hypothetical protein